MVQLNRELKDQCKTES